MATFSEHSWLRVYKVRSALRYLSRDESNGVLSLDDTIPSTDGLTTRDLLKEKHPTGSPARPESLMSDSPVPVVDLFYT